MTVEMKFKVHLARTDHGQVRLREGAAPPPPPTAHHPARIARVMALAHRIETLVRDGGVRDYAEVATLARLTRARISQLVNLLLLAPDIQERLLGMHRPLTGREPFGERHVRPIALEPDWECQRRRFAALVARNDDRRALPVDP